MANHSKEFLDTFEAITSENALTPEQFNQISPLGPDLMGEFTMFENSRQLWELEFMDDLRRYNRRYRPEEEARMQGRSMAYRPLTMVKVDTATARMMDLLFPANKTKNYDFKPTPIPTLPQDKQLELAKAYMQATNGQRPDEKTWNELIKQAADKSAAGMRDAIDDQMSEAAYKRECRKVINSGHMYGTGILKGPLVTQESTIRYVYDVQQKRYVQKIIPVTKPYMEAVNIWNFYPDMDATELRTARACWEHHRLSRQAMAALCNRKDFDGDKLREYINANPDGVYVLRRYESELRTLAKRELRAGMLNGSYDVFERWGWLNAEQLAQVGFEVPETRMHETFFANVWILPTGEIIRCQLLPEGSTWPYFLYKFKDDGTCIFSHGIPNVMADDQDMVNASTRAMVDNAAVASGPQIEVMKSLMHPETDYTNIHPRKIWVRTDKDHQFPALRSINIDSHIQELITMAQLFETSADETTMMPRYLYGDNPTSGAAGTMGGLSMLMAQANVALKNLVVAFDEGITKPFITALYQWNMRFNSDNDIKGDFDVVAMGASSLIAKEMRGQQAMQFMQALAPEMRPFVKWQSLLSQIAEAMDYSDVVMSEEEAQAAQQAQQEAAQKMQALQQSLMELQLKTGAAKLDEIGAKVQQMGVDAGEAAAKAVLTKVQSEYSAMQAAAIAINDPAVAAAADILLKAAGFTPPPIIPSGAGGMPPGLAEQQAGPVPAGAVPPGAPIQNQTGPANPGPTNADTTPMPTSGLPPTVPNGSPPTTAGVGEEAGIQTPTLGAGQ